MDEIKTSVGREEISWEECVKLLNDLPCMPVESKEAVIKKLLRNSSPGIRSRALQMGAVLFSDDRITELLKDGVDDVLRNAGLEILKAKGARAFNLAIELLKDSDPDVVLQAVLALDNLKDPRAFEPLRCLLSSNDINLVQSAIVAIGHMGDARAIPDLLRFLDGEPWLQFAAINALGDLRSAAAVQPLKELLTNIFLAPLAAEAMARIGGATVFKALAEYWLLYQNELDPETNIGLLAYVIEGMGKKQEIYPKLRNALAQRLSDESISVRQATARCLLAMGRGDEDDRALIALSGAYTDNSNLPVCLNYRKDLIGNLLSKNGVLCRWGLMLCARYPKVAPVSEIASFINNFADNATIELFDAETFTALTGVLGIIKSDSLAEPLLKLYTRVHLDARESLHDHLKPYSKLLISMIEKISGINKQTVIVLSAVLGDSPDMVINTLLELPDHARVEVISQILNVKPVMQLWPWDEFIKSSPETYTSLAARAAVKSNLRGLLPVLRSAMAEGPNADVIKAAGELGDRECIPLLIDFLRLGKPLVRALSIESLGKIGGPDARAVLRSTALSSDPKDSRIAYKSLAQCAIEEDCGFFRDAVSHADWYIRFACADVLGRFQQADNLAALAQLASDPVGIVSQRAISFLGMGVVSP